MIKTARQLKDLIRNLSREKSADAQLLMRNYMMERFLERISLSEYRDKFILKGGMLVAAMVGLDARSTMDLDATVKGANVNVEEIENLISAIVSVPIDDGVKFQLKSISEIMDEAEYPGIRVSMTTTFDGVVTPLKIDISTGDAITPREVRYSFKLMLEDRSIDIWAYNLETVLAEKLETIITRTTTNTRMRDFYDIYILDQLHGNTLNRQTLYDALLATAKKRGTERHLAEAVDVLNEVERNEEYAQAIKKRIGVQIDTKAVDKELEGYQAKLKEVDLNKTRLEREIDSLPADAKYRERKLHDMTLRLDSLYDVIVELEEKIEDARLRRDAIKQQAITLENIYKIMVNFDCVYNIINDEEKRNVVTALIKEIEIYRNDESEYPLKRIGLNFPVFKDGGEVTELLWDKGNTVDMVIMWEHMSCKALTGMHGQFEEQARARGIHLVWVCHDLCDPRVYTRQAIRDQLNAYMRTVMREEPLDPSIEVLPDENAW